MAQPVPGPSLVTALIVDALVQAVWKSGAGVLPDVFEAATVVDKVERSWAASWIGALQTHLLVCAFGVALGIYLWIRIAGGLLQVSVDNRQEVTLGVQHNAAAGKPRFARRGGGRLEAAPAGAEGVDILPS